VAEVELLARGHEDVAEALGLEAAEDRRSHQAAVTGDENASVGVQGHGVRPRATRDYKATPFLDTFQNPGLTCPRQISEVAGAWFSTGWRRARAPACPSCWPVSNSARRWSWPRPSSRHGRRTAGCGCSSRTPSSRPG